jgi:ribosomal protein L30/L7E
LVDLVVVLTGFVVVLIGWAVILVNFVVALTGFEVDLVSCVVGLVGLTAGLEDFWGLREEDTPDLALRVFSPSIDLFESIIYNYSMKVQKITKKQQAVLNFLEDFTEENGYSPSYREIMTGLGLSSVSAVAEHIDNMVSKGILKKVPGAARSLEVLDFRHTETVELFKNRLGECTEEERGVLVRAAEILGLDLE